LRNNSCAIADQQLNALRDIEEDEHDNMSSSSSAPNSHGGGLNQRRGSGGGGRNNNRETTGVLSDLEMIGVKPNASVSKAVTFIDSWTLFTGR
jgi:hypothetical protein